MEGKKVLYSEEVYMPGTQFEMRYFNGPDAMHQIATGMLSIGITWHSTGDPVNDPQNYTESFDIYDRYDPSNNRTGISRRECEDIIYSAYCNEIYK